jgi:hypothetical protein
MWLVQVIRVVCAARLVKINIGPKLGEGGGGGFESRQEMKKHRIGNTKHACMKLAASINLAELAERKQERQQQQLVAVDRAAASSGGQSSS